MASYCRTTYSEMKRMATTTSTMKQSTISVTQMALVVLLGSSAAFTLPSAAFFCAATSVAITPRNSRRKKEQAAAKQRIDDLCFSQLRCSYSQSKTRTLVTRQLNSASQISHLALARELPSTFRFIHSPRHLACVYFTEPVHLQGEMTRPSSSPSRQMRHSRGFLGLSGCWAGEEGGSGAKRMGTRHMLEESMGSVWFMRKFYNRASNMERKGAWLAGGRSQLIYMSEEESTSGSTRRIRKKFNIYMSETSKYNPFGPNSITSTYEEKRIFKYNLMKEYIRLTSKDQLYKEYEQSRFLGTIILGLVGGYFAAFALTALLTRGQSLRNAQPAKMDSLLYAVTMTAGFGYQYFASQERYNRNVCEYLLNKYLPQAIENGFEDYEISQ